MSSAFESITFSLLNKGDSPKKVRYSSISERLNTINASYFEKLYNKCVEIYGKEIGEAGSPVTRFDSTIVSLSGQLLKTGYSLKGSDSEYLRQLKFTIGFSEIPTTAHLFTDLKYTSENAALKEVILKHTPAKENAIRIFDRGITSRKTHDEMTAKKIPFISRINIKHKHKIHIDNILQSPIETSSLQIISDSWIYLYTTDAGAAKHPVRCIRATHKITNEELAFITNMHDLSAEDITNVYKSRWDIEVFFKFIKYELNFKHLVNRSENGIKVMLYATMIAAILLLVFKKKNKLSGYKIMRLQFLNSLEKAIMRAIVTMCDGDEKVFDKYFAIAPT